MTENRAHAPPPDDVSDPQGTGFFVAPAGDSAADPSEAPVGPPALIGRYRVAGEIARGGMGAILAARDPVLDRTVAIKVLLDAHQARPGYRERFLEEARITALLQHPGVVPVYEVGELPDARPFFAMEFVDGATLDAQLAARKSPTENLPHFLQVFEKVCQALAYAHSRGVIHRDLKPLNVMVAPFGVVKVMDWGVACQRAGPPGPAWGPPEVIGTPAYMAPEQARGDPRRVDERTDVFGLGGILCAVLTGLPLHLGASARHAHAQAVGADLAGAFGRLAASPAARELVALAVRCLAPDPADRPQNARAVTAALTAYLESDLRRAERDLVRFFELTPDLLCIADVNGRFRRVNGNFTVALGYSSDELLARPFLDFVHPDDRAGTVAETEKLARGQPVAQFRNRYRDVNGAYRWFEWAAHAIPEEQVVFAVARDVTDRVERERRANAGTDPGAAS